MTGLSLALANLKPGTGKTTSAVWLAHVFARAGNSVLLVDADPSGSALEWSDLAAMDPRLAAPQAAFPFRIVALPSRELHRRLPDIARDDDVVIIDAPQIEDHGAIARSALRYADEIVIPCAPNPIEINRTTPVRDEIADLQAVRDRPVRSAVLLNRCITRAHSISDARQALQDLGYDVLATAVPRLEVYAQSFGLPIPDTGRDLWRQVVRDLIERCAPPCPVRSLTARHHPVRPRQDHPALSTSCRPCGPRARAYRTSPESLTARLNCRHGWVIPGRRAGNRIALAPMDATAPPGGTLFLVVGYDGSPPATRALDAAVALLRGRTGTIEVVYVAHLPSIDMLSAGAVAEMDASFDEIAQELQTTASEQLRGREEHWRYERRQGMIPDELIAAAEAIRGDHPGDTVVIVVGSSSHAMHRVVGSVAVSLARHAPVPVVVVP